MKLLLQNPKLDGKIVRYDLIKPFDTIAFYASRQAWLEDRNLTITAYLAHVFKVFEDFKLIAEIREEIEKVKPTLILSF